MERVVTIFTWCFFQTVEIGTKPEVLTTVCMLSRVSRQRDLSSAGNSEERKVPPDLLKGVRRPFTIEKVRFFETKLA